jgi:hypothetical protein
MSTDDLVGIDYEWLAIDGDGHVGVFTSAGAGPIPRWFADDRAWCDAVLDVVASLPARGTFRLEVPDASTTPGLRDWKRWAEVGLFAYDWADIHRPTVAHSRCYELIAAPTTPIDARVLPAALRERPVLAGVCFAKTRLVDVAPFA